MSAQGNGCGQSPRYTQWDGTQRLKLDADKVFEKLAEYLSYTDDVRQAMDWMMRQGMDFDGVKVMGLEEFIEQLRQEMRQRYRDFNLKNALSEMEQKLEDILNRERSTLESLQGAEAGRRGKAARAVSGCRGGCRRRCANSRATSSRTRRPRRISTSCSRNTRIFATSKISAIAISTCSTVPRASATTRRSS